MELKGKKVIALGERGLGGVLPARCEEQDEGGSEGWSDRSGGSHAIHSLTRA